VKIISGNRSRHNEHALHRVRQGGRIISAAQKEHEQIFPQRAGWSTTRRDLAANARSNGRALAKGKLTSEIWRRSASRISVKQRRWEKATASGMNAIVWQTRASARTSRTSARRVARTFRAKTGLRLAHISAVETAMDIENVRGVASAQGGTLFRKYRYFFCGI